MHLYQDPSRRYERYIYKGCAFIEQKYWYLVYQICRIYTLACGREGMLLNIYVENLGGAGAGRVVRFCTDNHDSAGGRVKDS